MNRRRFLKLLGVGFPALASTKKYFFFRGSCWGPVACSCFQCTMRRRRWEFALDPVVFTTEVQAWSGYQYFTKGDAITIAGMPGKYVVDQVHRGSVDLLRTDVRDCAMNYSIGPRTGGRE